MAVLLAILFFILFSVTHSSNAKLKKELADAKEQSDIFKTKCDRLQSDNELLATRVESLQKWVVIEDAQAEADRIIASANMIYQSVIERGQQLEKTSKEDAKALKDIATHRLDYATKQAETIVENARKQAESIAGDAYEAMRNSDLYEKTARAMKNIIKGYGNEYLVPNYSFLDELADDFSHTVAGQELKSARERSSLMVKHGTAAKCEYVEENRKDTAIRFVIDAFNGKVDTILTRVKHDNAGKLTQEIEDSFNLVNYNGKAFREARIVEEYKKSRQEELRWAVIVQELKLKEREEQRLIKEQIREEERALREYEKAKKEAEREEELVRKAMEKAYAQIEKSSGEQREKYEAQLQELEAKLVVALEKSQRAQSMAQQTKQGHVYIISNIGSFGEHVYKIGMTRRLEPLDRIKELGDASVPFEFDVHAMIYNSDAPGLERALHKHFALNQMNKVNYRKEFFKVDLASIRSEIEGLGLSDIHWTMCAEAREYRESLAIEQQIVSDSTLRDAWLSRQLVLDPISIERELV